MRVLIGLLLNLYLLSSCFFEDSLSLDNYTLDISYEENIIPSNILIFLVDDLREDATPYLIYPLIEYFPAIDKIQKEGTRFSNPFVTTSFCSPSRERYYQAFMHQGI